MRIRWILALLSLSSASAYADTAIETETAQIGEQGEIGISQSVEYEHATDGQFVGTLTQFEYGITDRSELLIEPFFGQWIIPNDGPTVGGVGDLEITPSYMVILEDSWIPAVLLATKLKVPTAPKKVEGTGKVDFYPYLILGQHFADWTFNFNLGVNFAMPPDGTVFDKTLVWDVEAERAVAPELTWFIETFSAEDGVWTGSTALEYQFTPHFNAFVAVSYTEEHSVIVRPGINLQF